MVTPLNTGETAAKIPKPKKGFGKIVTKRYAYCGVKKGGKEDAANPIFSLRCYYSERQRLFFLEACYLLAFSDPSEETIE